MRIPDLGVRLFLYISIESQKLVFAFIQGVLV